MNNIISYAPIILFLNIKKSLIKYVLFIILLMYIIIQLWLFTSRYHIN
jgi:hypothetical protein